MKTIRLIEGFNDKTNTQYIRDYEIKNRSFLDDENLMYTEQLDIYFANSVDKFNYDYYHAEYYDAFFEGYLDIYFCIKKERYIIYTDMGIYEFSRGDTIYKNETGIYPYEILITEIRRGDYITLTDDDNAVPEFIQEIEIVED